MRHLGLILTSFLLVPVLRAETPANAPSTGPWADLLERYVAWDETGRGRDEPWDGAKLPTPQEEEFLYANPPKDPRQALGLALFAMSNHRHPEMRAVLERAAKEPGAPARVHALLACFLVTEARYQEALSHLDAARPDDTCGLTMMPISAFPLRVMRAIALHGVGRGAEARALLSPTMPTGATTGARVPVVAEPCLLGDLAELDGDLAAAEKAWTAGACRERLEELRVIREPFEVLREGWSMGGSTPDGRSALASALLGDVDGARTQLEGNEGNCAQPAGWTPDCLRLAALRSRLAPALGQATAAAALRSLAPFEERATPEGMLAPFDPEGDEPEDVEEPPEALADWYVVRVERSGDQVFAVSAGREARIDSGGDMLPLYRLHVSRDGGQSFKPPVLLGLEPDCPCRVRTVSRIPILSESGVQLEVLCKPALVGSETLRPALIAAPTSALTRDADGDGLSDAQEFAWRLDPKRADTDGDTVPDGRDPSPRVPPGWTRPELDSLLEWLVSDDAPRGMGVAAKDLPPRATTTPSASAATSVPSRQEPLALILLRPLQLLERRRGIYNDASAGPRVIALSQSEADSCGEDPFSMFTPSSLTRLRLVFDLDGSRALVSLSDSDGGSSYLAMRNGDGWTLHGIVGWVH